jgi:glycine oxidase
VEAPNGRLLAFSTHSPQMMVMAKIDVIGAGMVGLWHAYLLRLRGHEVTLWDSSGIPGRNSASRLAGVMIAPYCEGEPGHEIGQALGMESFPLWQEHYPDLIMAGSLVVAAPRDQADLQRYASQTSGYRRLDAAGVGKLEPALNGRFREGLFYPEEAHIEPLAAMEFFAKEAQRLGVEFMHQSYESGNSDWIADCRGIWARADLKTLRGLRGERIVLESPDVKLGRPVRLLHPRIPFYIVPWSNNRFMIGATVIESEDEGPATLRSVAELMSCAYALIPELGEARIVDIAAGVRPCFPDNAPKIIVRSRHLFVNGLYRHGFLASPILAQLTGDYIESGTMREGVVFEDYGEW